MRQRIARIHLVLCSVQFIVCLISSLYMLPALSQYCDVGNHLGEPLLDSGYQSQAQTQVAWNCIALCCLKNYYELVNTFK